MTTHSIPFMRGHFFLSYIMIPGEIKGSGEKSKFGAVCKVPYGGKVLEGEALRKQLDKWADYGTIEPSARDAISYLIDNPKVLDLSDKVRTLLKASAHW